MIKYPWACNNHDKKSLNPPDGGCDDCYKNMRKWLDDAIFNCKICNEPMPEVVKSIRGIVTIPLWHNGLSYEYKCNFCEIYGDEQNDNS